MQHRLLLWTHFVWTNEWRYIKFTDALFNIDGHLMEEDTSCPVDGPLTISAPEWTHHQCNGGVWSVHSWFPDFTFTARVRALICRPSRGFGIRIEFNKPFALNTSKDPSKLNRFRILWIWRKRGKVEKVIHFRQQKPASIDWSFDNSFALSQKIRVGTDFFLTKTFIWVTF